MTTADKKSFEVDQMQTLEWADLSAPDDTETMRVMIHKTIELKKSKKG